MNDHTKNDRTPAGVDVTSGRSSLEYVKRMLAWIEFQQKLGNGLSNMLGIGIKRVASSGLKPSLVAANDDSGRRKLSVSKEPPETPTPQQRYQRWIAKIEQHHKTARLPVDGPLISIILPIYNPPIHCLIDGIESVLSQSYQNWQLILVNDKSTTTEANELLARFGASDERIISISRLENGHISEASQTGLDAASGEFIALLDHDDLLPVRALARMAKEINRYPDAKFFYSDEDKINEHGDRYEPHFKSDWNPQLLLAQNYICHLSVISRELAQECGGFRKGFEGSQDHDLTLRCTAKLRPDQIRHVPEVLYHWRAIQGSTSLASDQKTYASQAGLRAVQEFLDLSVPGCRVVPADVPNAYRVRYPLPEKPPKVCLIIPTRNQKAITEQAINSILHKTEYQNYEILLIDNESTEADAVAYFVSLNSYDNIRVLRYNKPFNYSAINNFAVAQTDAEIVGFINNDIEVINENWLTEMVSLALRPESGCIGAKLYYAENKIQHAGVILGIGGVAGHSHKYFPKEHHGYFSRLALAQNLSAVTGACMLVRKSVYEQVNGLEENELKIAFNDVDFCLRVRAAGYLNVWTPYAELYHHESLSRGKEDTPEKVRRFNKEADWMRATWHRELENDPYYNPNLSLSHEDFSIVEAQ
ncbi:MAG: glycosyltransferase family 2 protein [Pseudomonadota bacterium]